MDFAPVVGVLSYVFFVAYILEKIVEQLVAPIVNYFAYRNKTIDDLRGWLIRMVAILLGVAISFGQRVDAITPLVVLAGIPTTSTFIGTLLTGIGIGGGSSWLHDWFGSWLDKKK